MEDTIRGRPSTAARHLILGALLLRSRNPEQYRAMLRDGLSGVCRAVPDHTSEQQLVYQQPGRGREASSRHRVHGKSRRVPDCRQHP